MNIENIVKDYKENFSQLLEESFKNQPKEGSIVKGKIVSINNDSIFIDVGLKSEGRVSLHEFPNKKVTIGDEVDIYIDRLEGRNGCVQLSREKVAKELSWNKFEELNASDSSIIGKIIGKVNKGGFAVEIDSILAFLPGSQLDIRPVKDPSLLMNIEQPFKILKIDREQGNIVVSRRAILEESRKEAKSELLSTIKEGMTFTGVVKNITNYGAFIDLGDIDGLLHITDISWDKISHPSERLALGQEMKVVVTKYNAESQRVSLGLKQLTKNPWEGLEEKYAIGTKHRGKVLSTSDYGVFVELEKSIEGLVYLNEIGWNTKNIHPTKLVNIGDDVDTIILDLDIEKHRISLSIKKCIENPWKQFIINYPIGTIIKAKVKKVVDFGLFVNVLANGKQNELDVLVPAIEISHDDNPRAALKEFKTGDEIEGVISSSDLEKERVTISIKQLAENNYKKTIDKLMKAKVVTCKVLQVTKDGLYVEAPENIKGFVKRLDISKHRDQQKPERFAIGDKIDARVIFYDKVKKIAHLSVKIVEIADEQKAIREYGSVDSGASLGDILGAAIEKQDQKNK